MEPSESRLQHMRDAYKEMLRQQREKKQKLSRFTTVAKERCFLPEKKPHSLTRFDVLFFTSRFLFSREKATTVWQKYIVIFLLSLSWNIQNGCPLYVLITISNGSRKCWFITWTCNLHIVLLQNPKSCTKCRKQPKSHPKESCSDFYPPFLLVLRGKKDSFLFPWKPKKTVNNDVVVWYIMSSAITLLRCQQRLVPVSHTVDCFPQHSGGGGNTLQLLHRLLFIDMVISLPSLSLTARRKTTSKNTLFSSLFGT